MNMKITDTSPELITLLQSNGEFTAVAAYCCQRLRWNTQLPWPVLSVGPLTIGVAGNGCAVLFRHGVVVMFNMFEEQCREFLAELKPMMQEPLADYEQEQVLIRIDPQGSEGADFESLLIREVTLPRLQIIAAVLAKSTTMAYYESKVAQQFDRIEPIAAQLQHGRRASHHSRELLRHIGETLMMEARMVGRAEVMEKPDMLWEFPELDRFYCRLEDEYELTERYEALERKLGLIARTAETQLSLLQQRGSLRVEWYIVILIVIEIVLMLFLPH
jgi:uncharacterized Rmd1/YagE family protein